MVFYSGHGQWEWADIDVCEVSNECGLFILPEKNIKEIKYQGKTTAQYLLPCKSHSDGVYYQGKRNEFFDDFYECDDDFIFRILDGFPEHNKAGTHMIFTKEDVIDNTTITNPLKNKGERHSVEKINYASWALYENFDAFTAAALWCDRNPYYYDSWSGIEYVEVRNLIIHILKHQLDAENYPIRKRNAVVLELGKRFDVGRLECVQESFKFIISREQLIMIAIKMGVKPNFLFGTSIIQGSTPTKPEEIKRNVLIKKEPELCEKDTLQTKTSTAPHYLNTESEKNNIIEPTAKGLSTNGIKEFIELIIDSFPQATSKDIVSHCFECYARNNRKLTEIKKIIADLGIKKAGSGKRTSIAIKYMQTAPKYKPTQ